MASLEHFFEAFEPVYDAELQVLFGDEFFETMAKCQGLCVETSLAPLLKFAAEMLGCRKVSVVLRKEDGSCYVAAAVGIAEEYIGISVEESCLSAAVMSFGKPAYLDMKQNAGFRRMGGNGNTIYQSNRYFGVPLFCGQKFQIGGVLNVTDVRGAIDNSFQQLLILIAVYVTQVLRRISDELAKTNILLRTIDMRDHYTAGHCRRVSEYALLIAEAMSRPQKDRFALETYGKIHDLGKIGVRDEILNKPGKLSELEFEEIRRHPDLGAEALSDGSDGTVIILEHHERWDGQGYNGGKKGGGIDPRARILGCADAFDAMMSDRPFRLAMRLSEALGQIERGAGSQFDPSVVEVFLRIARDRPSAIAEAASRVRKNESRQVKGGS